MSIIDVLFVFLYCLCGTALARVFMGSFGAAGAVVGFILGFAGAMLVWRVISKLLWPPRKRLPRPNGAGPNDNSPNSAP